jgi:ribonuclease HI
LTVSSGYGASCIFYTDSSLIVGCAGFAVPQMGMGRFEYNTAELSALFTALRHNSEVIRPPERCLILTDSLSSIKAMLSRKIAHQTHSLVYECKQLSSLCQNGIEVKLMWILSHIGLALEGTIFDRPLSSSVFQSLARPPLTRAWQAKWDSADTGRLAHSYFFRCDTSALV